MAAEKALRLGSLGAQVGMPPCQRYEPIRATEESPQRSGVTYALAGGGAQPRGIAMPYDSDVTKPCEPRDGGGYPGTPERMLGTTLEERYQVRKMLGAGGMGYVYMAYDTRLFRTVALKVPREDLAYDVLFRNRFHREAVAMSNLRHDNIVNVFDVVLSESRAQLSYIVMEYVEGEPLDSFLITHKKLLSVGQVLDLLHGVAAALDLAHSKGAVHRDIKPQNILVTHDKHMAKLMDFGLAKVVVAGIYRTGDNTRLDPGSRTYSPAYASPEQIRGEVLDAATDIYSFGIALHQIFSSHLPYPCETPACFVYHHQNCDPIPIEKQNPRWPPELGKAVARTLRKEPGDRPISASRVMGDVEEALDGLRGEPFAAFFDLEAEDSTLTGASGLQSAVKREQTRRQKIKSKRRRSIYLLSVLISLLIGIGIIAAVPPARDAVWDRGGALWGSVVDWTDAMFSGVESPPVIPAPTPTPTPTPKPTATPAPTETPGPTPPPTPEPEHTPRVSMFALGTSPTVTATPIPSPTPEPTAEPTPEPTESPTPPPAWVPEPTPEPTPLPSLTPEPAPTETPPAIKATSTSTPEPSETPVPTATAEPALAFPPPSANVPERHWEHLKREAAKAFVDGRLMGSWEASVVLGDAVLTNSGVRIPVGIVAERGLRLSSADYLIPEMQIQFGYLDSSCRIEEVTKTLTAAEAQREYLFGQLAGNDTGTTFTAGGEAIVPPPGIRQFIEIPFRDLVEASGRIALPLYVEAAVPDVRLVCRSVQLRPRLHPDELVPLGPAKRLANQENWETGWSLDGVGKDWQGMPADFRQRFRSAVEKMTAPAVSPPSGYRLEKVHFARDNRDADVPEAFFEYLQSVSAAWRKGSAVFYTYYAAEFGLDRMRGDLNIKLKKKNSVLGGKRIDVRVFVLSGSLIGFNKDTQSAYQMDLNGHELIENDIYVSTSRDEIRAIAFPNAFGQLSPSDSRYTTVVQYDLGQVFILMEEKEAPGRTRSYNYRQCIRPSHVMDSGLLEITNRQ